MDNNKEIDINIKPQIDFPCIWNYRIIGFNKEFVLNAIKNVFNENVNISPIEHISSNGKYIAMNCSIEVKTDNERLGYFDCLTKQDGIIMVI